MTVFIFYNSDSPIEELAARFGLYSLIGGNGKNKRGREIIRKPL